jgi:ABC-type proline/glycine betaine transport system substrate-binding protein
MKPFTSLHIFKTTKRSYREIISKTLTVTIGVLIASYIVMMVQTVSLVNERKDIREETRQTQVTISDLEIQYFQLAQSIDKETIEKLGFKESVLPVFAYTKPVYDTVALLR